MTRSFYHRLPILLILIALLTGTAYFFLTSHSSAQRTEMSEHAVSYVDDNQGKYDNASLDSTFNFQLERARTASMAGRQIIEHTGYTVCYNLRRYIPDWVAYELTAEELSGENERTNKFLPDPLVQGDPVVTSDYTRSGYDRGHMAPAADMKWSEDAMKESFYMTNICPQNHNNNAGDWKDLEEFVRDLAGKYGSLYVCCGPIVTNTTCTIGTVRKIVVPQAFYKVLLRRKTDGTWTAIGFLMSNEPANRPLMTYMLPVREIEQHTGIDFFYALPDSIETAVEADYTVADWTL